MHVVCHKKHREEKKNTTSAVHLKRKDCSITKSQCITLYNHHLSEGSIIRYQLFWSL